MNLNSVTTSENEKRVWEAPVVEEMDFSSTEAAYLPGLPADLGIYTV